MTMNMLSQTLDNEFITFNPEEHNKSYSFLNAIIVPRPIAFITTQGKNGIVNAAPFSYFNAVCSQPTILSISIERRKGHRKDTAINIFSTKEFVVNMCSVHLAKAVSQASKDFPPEVSEIDLTGLSLVPSQKILVPRIANSPIQMECRLKQSIEIEGSLCDLILGEVLKIHVHKTILNDKGHIDFEKLNPLARLAGTTYAQLSHFFDVIS